MITRISYTALCSFLVFTLGYPQEKQKDAYEKQKSTTTKKKSSMKSGSVTIVPDVDCLVSIDGEQAVQLGQGQLRTFSLSSGDHTMLVYTTDLKDTLRKALYVKAGLEIRFDPNLKSQMAARTARDAVQEERAHLERDKAEQLRRVEQRQRETSQGEARQPSNNRRGKLDKSSVSLYGGRVFPISLELQSRGARDGFVAAGEYDAGLSQSFGVLLLVAYTHNAVNAPSGLPGNVEITGFSNIWVMTGVKLAAAFAQDANLFSKPMLGLLIANPHRSTQKGPDFTYVTESSSKAEVAFGGLVGIQYSLFDLTLGILYSYPTYEYALKATGSISFSDTKTYSEKVFLSFLSVGVSFDL